MNSTKPVYVFVGGVSHTPTFFEGLMLELLKHGYESAAVPYPTCGDNTENVKQWDEVITIQQAVLDFLDKDRDVVLFCHSYGGWPGSRAIKGLDKESRLKEGKATGIVEVIFLAAFLLPDNAPMEVYSYLPPWLTVENGRRIPNEACVPLLFSDMDVTAQKHWLGQFAWQRNDFTAKTVPNAPWELSIPKTYIITTLDKGATPDFQFKMLQDVMTIRPDTWTIKSINSGHEPFLSQPAKLVQVILQPILLE